MTDVPGWIPPDLFLWYNNPVKGCWQPTASVDLQQVSGVDQDRILDGLSMDPFTIDTFDLKTSHTVLVEQRDQTVVCKGRISGQQGYLIGAQSKIEFGRPKKTEFWGGAFKGKKVGFCLQQEKINNKLVKILQIFILKTKSFNHSDNLSSPNLKNI